MANKLQFDVGMNNTEAMTGTKEIARAMASLESTVKNVSKGMASSLTGYSDAIQRNVKATHDYNAEMRKLESAASQIRSALAGVKEESVAFTILKKESKEAEANVARLTEKLNKLNSTERASGTTAFERMDNQVESLDKKIDGLQSKLTHMKEVRDKLYYIPGGTAKYDAQIKSTEKELALAQKERDSLQSKMDAAVDKDLNLDTNIEEVTHQLEQAQSVLEAYNARRDEMLADGSAYSDQSVVEMTKQLGELESQLAAMRSAAMETPEFVESVVNDLNEQVEAQVESLKELQQQREELAKAQDESTVQAFGNADDYDTYGKNFDTYSDYIAKNQGEIEELENRAEELRAQIEEIRSDGDVVNKASTLTELEDELSEAESRLEQYYSFVEDWQERIRNILVKAFGSEEAAAEWESGENALTELDGQIDQTSEKIDELQDKIDSLTNAGGDLEGTVDAAEREVAGEKEDVENAQAAPTANLDSVNDSVRAASSFLDEYMRKWNQMITVSGMAKNAMATVMTPILHPIQAADRAIGALIVKVGQMASAFARMAGNAALSFLRKLASEAQNAAIQLAKLASNAIHGAFQKLAQGASAAGRGLLGLVKNNKAADGSFKRGFMTIMKYAFGVRSMYFLFRRLRTAVKEAFTEMAKSSPEVNAAIRGLQTALNGLKGSLASAFAPIFTAVAPALIYLINMLTAAMNALGAFFAALTGQSSFKKAVGGMKAVGGGAGGASKKVKELKKELLGFDELNIVHGNDDNGGGGGGGGGGGAMSFVDEQIPGGIKDFVDKLKELWNNKEYVKIGKLIADWINKAIAEAKDLITWENVSAKIQEFVDAIAGIIEGLLIYVDWKNIGDTIAEAFRTVTNTIDTFMQKVGVFMLAGSALAAMVNGFFGNKKLWTDIGKTITDSVHSFLAFGQAFLDGFDAEEAGRGIRSAILTVGDKLPEIAAEFWELVKTAFNKAGSFVNALLGGGEEQPDLSKYVRPKPVTVKPKFDVDASVWDELAERLSTGFNTAIESVTTFIRDLPVGSAVTALAGWFVKLREGINFEGLGALFGVAFRKMLDGIGAWIDSWSAEAATIGGKIATAINGFISEAFKGDTISEHFSTLVKGAFSFLTAFLSKLDEENIATELREAITGIDWDGIAKAAWEAFKIAVGKLGNFLTILLGGDVEPDISKYVRKRPAGMEKQESSQVTSLAQAIGKAVSAALTKLDEWINKIPWDEWGAKIHEFLANLPWGEWGSQLAQALLDLFENLKEFFGNLVFGKEGYEDYKAYSAGDHRGQHKKVESGNVSQEWYDQYVQLAKQVENYLMNGSWTFNVGSALSLTGWEDFTQETQYAYFMALQNAFTGKEIYDYLTSKGKEATNALAEGIQRGDIDVSEDGEDVVLTFADGTKTQLAKSSEEIQKLFEQLGVDSVAGLTTAFGNEQESANTATTEMMDGVVETANDRVKTGSPSKVFEELGNNIVAGLIIGLQDLPSKLQTIWEALPEWAQTMFASLGKTLGIDINANASGGNNGNSGGDSGVSNKDTRKNTKASKKETKETQKNTKELKKNTAKRGEVDVNYEGAGFDTSGDKPKLNVGVNFVPEGEEASEENSNGGLLGWLQSLFDADTIEAKVELIRQGWENFKTFLSEYGVDENTPIKTLIDLVRNNFTDFMGFLGIDPNSPIAALIKLLLDNAENILDFLGIDPNTPINTVIALLLQKFDSLLDFLGIDENNPIRVLLNLVKNLFDPDAESVLEMDDKTIEALVKLIKEGFKTFLGFLGIDTDSPLIKTAIQLIKNGFTSLLQFLGFDTDNPVIKTIVDLLFGKEDKGAKEALAAENKDVDVSVDLEKGEEDSQAKDTLSKGGKTFTSILKAGVDKASTWVSEAFGLTQIKDGSKTNASVNVAATASGDPDKTLEVSKITNTPVNKAVSVKGTGSKDNTSTTLLDGQTVNKPVSVNGTGTNDALSTTLLDGQATNKPVSVNGTGTNDALSTTLLNGETVTKKVTFKEEGSDESILTSVNGKTTNKKIKMENNNTDASILTSVNGKTTKKLITLQRSAKSSGTIKKAVSGSTTDKPIKLKQGSGSDSTVTKAVDGKDGNMKINLNVGAIASLLKDVFKTLGWLATGGAVSGNGHVKRFARGGVIRGGMSRYLDSVPHYAGGTTRAHGTVFIAGEAGPEIMGHINGRTEILNKSQIAEAIYSAVTHGMGAAVNALGKYIANHMTNCTNSIVQTIAANAGPISGVDYYAPAMATGGIMPYDVAMQIARSTQELQNTLDANNEDLIQAMVSAVGNAAQSIVQAMMTQAARGNQVHTMNTRQVIDDINRAGQMFGQSPIKGV